MVRYVLAALVLFSGAAFAQSTAFLRIEDSVVGEIRGDVDAPGREGSIRLFGWSHQITTPVGPNAPRGQRVHTPLVLTKRIDRTSPLLAALLASAANIPDVRIELYRGNRLFYTIELENASVAGIASRGGRTLPDPKVKPENDGRDFEEVSFTYQRITWTFAEGAITATDEWPRGDQ